MEINDFKYFFTRNYNHYFITGINEGDNDLYDENDINGDVVIPSTDSWEVAFTISEEV